MPNIPGLSADSMMTASQIMFNHSDSYERITLVKTILLLFSYDPVGASETIKNT